MLWSPIHRDNWQGTTVWISTVVGCKRIRTTSYHPIANGMIEHFHRQLKSILKSYPNTADWTTWLCWVFKLQDFNCTPAEPVYGTTIRIPRRICDHLYRHFHCRPNKLRCQAKNRYVKAQSHSTMSTKASTNRHSQVAANLYSCLCGIMQSENLYNHRMMVRMKFSIVKRNTSP